MALARGHTKLDAELIQRARQLAGMGLPDKSIAAGCGVAYPTLHKWLSNAQGENPTKLENRFLEAMREGALAGEAALIDRLHRQAKNDPKCSTWLLSHSPRWRDTWSDSAQTKREVNRLAGMFVTAMEQVRSITPQQQREILLRVQAMGAAVELVDFSEDQPPPHP